MATAKGKARRTVTYRRAVILPAQKQTLQQLVSTAIGQCKAVTTRLEPLDAASTELRAIGEHKEAGGVLVGYLSSFARGRAQPTVTEAIDAEHLKLGAAPPPAGRKGARIHYSPGCVFFVIKGNHMAVSQTMNVRASNLEGHLSWLLKQRTSVLPATTGVILSDDAQKATKARIRQSHVKSITFGAPLMELAPAPTLMKKSENGEKQKKSTRFMPAGPMANVLKQFFRDDQFESMGFNDVYDSNIEVRIEVRFPKRKRSQAEETVRFMDTLGVALRDMEGDDVSLSLADGHKVSGKELKISGTIEMSSAEAQEEIWSEMVFWLNKQIENGVVSPD